jgi:hypothetical protein
VSGRIAGVFVRLPHVKRLCHWRGNWSGLIHSELHQDRLNVAVPMDADCVVHLIPFDIRAATDRHTPEIIHPEPVLYLISDLPNKPYLPVKRRSSTYRMTAATTLT